MPVELNHTIVAARDKNASARWLGDVLGLPVRQQYGPFVPLETSNGVALDFMDTEPERIVPQHYAFLVAEDEFDAILARLQQAGITHYADPGFTQPERINHNDGGRATYFADADGHAMEILTVPYGGTSR